MAVLGFIGFDYDSPDSPEWEASFDLAVRATSPTPRTGTHCLDCRTSPFGKTLSNLATVVCGTAHYAAGTGLKVLTLWDGVTEQITVYIESDRSITVRRGDETGTILGQSEAATWLPNAWNYIEVKATINNSSGAVLVWLNGADDPILNIAATDTQATAHAYSTLLQWADGYLDDCYVLNTTGDAPGNDRLGDVRVRCLYPTAAGSFAEWSPLASTNVSNVDDAGTPDDDTTYNSTALNAKKDTFTITHLPETSAAIIAVQERWRARKTDAGAKSAKPKIISGVAGLTGPTKSLSTSYASYLGTILELNPDGAAVWTIASVNALEIGVESVS